MWSLCCTVGPDRGSHLKVISQQIPPPDGCCCCCCFSHSAHWLPTRKKLLYTVANPAHGLLNRGKKKKEKSGSAPPPHPARCSFGEKKKKKKKNHAALRMLGMSFYYFSSKTPKLSNMGLTAYLNDSVPEFYLETLRTIRAHQTFTYFSVIGSAAFHEDRREVYSHPLHLQPCRTHSALSTTSTFSYTARFALYFSSFTYCDSIGRRVLET